MKLLHAVQHVAWSYSSGSFLEAVERSSQSWRVFVLFCAGLLVGVVRWVLRRLSAEDDGELSETVWFRSGKFSTTSTIVRSLLSIVIVGMGASLGREGALKQTGAAIAARLAAWAGLPASQMRLLAAYGAGAGMAAAYNVPCGGALFALEVLLGGLSLRLVVPALATSCIATAVSWMLLPNRPSYAVPAYALSATQIAWALIAGPLFGLASVLWIRSVAMARRHQPSCWVQILMPAAVFTALGFLAVFFPQLLGNGKDVVQAAFTENIDLALLLILPVLKLVATATCLGSGAPGGLFTPTMTIGALLGGLLGYACHAASPEAPLGSYAILGAGAVLAASTQGPVSAIVLTLELTWHIDPLMAPLLIVVVGATLVAHYFESRSIYSSRLHEIEPVAASISGTRFDDLLLPEYNVVSAAASFPEVARRLLGFDSWRLPLYVVDELGQLIGEIKAIDVSEPTKVSVPRETAIASDFAAPVPTISACNDRDEVMRQLRDSGSPQLPVIETTSGRIVGAVAESLLAVKSSRRLVHRTTTETPLDPAHSPQSGHDAADNPFTERA